MRPMRRFRPGVRNLEGTVELASTQLPATAAVGILSVEFLVHAWDFGMDLSSRCRLRAGV